MSKYPSKTTDVKERRIVDIEVSKEGYMFLFFPTTNEGREWLERHVGSEATWQARVLVVEPRYALDLAQAAMDAGLEVE